MTHFFHGPGRTGAATLVLALAPVSLATPAAAEASDDTESLPELRVTVPALLAPDTGARMTATPEDTVTQGVDAADLAGDQPGASVNDNGPISGQVQYRGMFGPRLGVRLDGMYINSGGPNWMDPPLHYAPGALLDRVEVVRGIAPARHSAESIGGGVDARFKTSRFAAGDALDWRAEVSAGARSAHAGGQGAAFASAATDRHRVHAMASAEAGGDIRFPGGRIKASRHERYLAGGGYGVRLAPGHALSFDYRHSETDDTGTPSLPMDIRFFDTETLKSGYEGTLGDTGIEAALSYSDIAHKMDNVTLRSTPTPRETFADSSGFGWRLAATRPLGAGEVTLGTDGHLAHHDVRVRNPRNPAFRVDSFNDIDRDRVGGFLGWDGEVASKLDAKLDLRATRVRMSAGEAGTGAMPNMPPVDALAAGFNARDRDVTDTLLDWTAKLGYRLSETVTLRLEGGRKSRAPGYVERFAWLPTQASSGLADGNNYVGDVGLDPEVAHEIGAGVDYDSANAYFRPRVFYRDVEDFITGTPFDDTPGVIDSTVEMVSSNNGDPTPLRFANTGAEFYGVDVDFGYRFTAAWRLDGQVSLTRGERTDIDDDVYRVPPAQGRARLSYDREVWGGFLGVEWSADEDRVSRTNNDPSTADPQTPGYALFNLGVHWSPLPGGLIQGSVTNLFDRDYQRPLAGYNRVAGSDVPVGERLPGAGRSFVLRVRQRF